MEKTMVDAKLVAELRRKSGAGIVECKNALEETGGNIEEAMEVLRKKGIAKAGKKADRATKEGLIYGYVHNTGKVGALVEVSCETDFVARNEAFKELCHDIAMQVVAMNPLYVSQDDVKPEVVEKEKEIYAEEMKDSGKSADVVEKIIEGKLGKWYGEVCLLNQAFIKDEDMTIEDVVKNAIAKMGENIQIKRFTRYGMDSSDDNTC